MHLEYDGFRLPNAGEWYGSWSTDHYEFRIHESSIDFLNVRQHVYCLVPDPEISETPLTDRFDEWNW